MNSWYWICWSGLALVALTGVAGELGAIHKELVGIRHWLRRDRDDP